MSAVPTSNRGDPATASSERLRRVIRTHLDSDGGSAFWIERARSLGIDSPDEVREPADLRRFGDMTPDDLTGHRLVDLIPRRFHGELDRFVIGQTGGTTGSGVWTAYRDDEFEEAFVAPFVAAATAVGFPQGVPWLYVGPGGPHLIGRAARRLARRTGAMDPFTVDFDPKWAKKLPAGSFAAMRYLEHIVDQAIDVIGREDVGAIFTTPVVLARLAARMRPIERARIRGVHYGGMPLGREELERNQRDLFPEAVHLSGYGNTLFGCCPELSTAAGRSLDYFPHGERLMLEIVDAAGRPVTCGPGRVRVTRLDESMLLIGLLERDQAIAVDPPRDAPAGFALAGVRDPGTRTACVRSGAAGLY